MRVAGLQRLTAVALVVAAALSLAPAAHGADEPPPIAFPNTASLPLPPEVTDRCAALHKRLIDEGLWPAATATRTEGGTRFRHLGATHLPLSLATADRLMHDLDRVARRVRAPDEPGDLVQVRAIEGDMAARRLTLVLGFGFPLSEVVALATHIQFAPLTPESTGASVRYAAKQGFVRGMELDLVLVPDPNGGTVAGFELAVATDWRGVAVTRAMFERHVVRKVRGILESLVTN
jgi:hypothetical protein